MNNLEIIPENAEQLIKEIEQAFFDIPFENSDFQTENFVIASQITPERAYRAIGLRIHSKLQALIEAQYTQALAEIDIKELEEKNQDSSINQWDRMRNQLKIQKMLSGRSWGDKLISDAIHELTVLYRHFRSLPRYTRDQFESGEAQHFRERLHRQIQGITGAQESLANMEIDAHSLNKYEELTQTVDLDRAKTLALNNFIATPVTQSLTPTQDKQS